MIICSNVVCVDSEEKKKNPKNKTKQNNFCFIPVHRNILYFFLSFRVFFFFFWQLTCVSLRWQALNRSLVALIVLLTSTPECCALSHSDLFTARFLKKEISKAVS